MKTFVVCIFCRSCFGIIEDPGELYKDEFRKKLNQVINRYNKRKTSNYQLSNGNSEIEVLALPTFGEPAWLPVHVEDSGESVMSLLNSVDTNRCDSDTTQWFEKISEQLHNMTDNLPMQGCLIDVIWFLDGAESCDLGVVGAISRLVKWNSAQVYFSGKALSQDCVSWCRVLNGRVVESIDDVIDQDVVWRGGVGINSDQDSLKLKGFYLVPNEAKQPCIDVKICEADNISKHRHSNKNADNIYYAKNMDVIEMVNTREVPTFFYTGETYRLYTSQCNSSSCNKFIQSVTSNPNVSCLVQLQYSRTYDVTGSNSYDSWCRYQLASAKDEPKVQLGHTNKLVFVLSSASASDYCLARLLRQADQLNGAVIHHLTSGLCHCNHFTTEKHDTVTKLLDALFCYNFKDICERNITLSKIQDQVILDCIAHGTRIGIPELIQIVNTCEKNTGDIPATSRTTESGPEYSFKRISWDPKIRMEVESLKARSKASENSEGLVKTSIDKSMSLNAKSFLNMFESDGNPVSQSDVLQGCKHGLLRHKSSTENLEWPGSKHSQSQGIYYNNSEVCESKDISCKRIQDRIQFETSATCSSEQTNNPATVNMLCLADKKSERSKVHKRHKSPNSKIRPHKILPRKTPTKSIQTESRQHNITIIYQKNVTRKDKHTKILRDVVTNTLKPYGIRPGEEVFTKVANRLFKVTKSFVKDLTSSVNLKDKMKKIAEGQVELVIEFEKKHLKSR